MDYCAAFRPIFVYVTHLARNLPDGTQLPFPFPAVREDLQKIILAAFQNPDSSTPQFDQAWFAVRCWLGERLETLPHGSELRDRLVDVPENAGSEFFLRLNRLLDGGSPELLKMYAACLELGFKGYYARPGHEADLAGYLAACRQRLGADREAPASVKKAPPTPFRAVLRILAWAAPVAATLLLYYLYRMALSDLYATVVR
ncbi:MAG: DotU family type IV/VI secretion system protein [Planctomycetota bacterium]|jgi:hypothetical protein|nr:DotU family type IV/VI secretion system protein [Planctomycetota bacterium]